MNNKTDQTVSAPPVKRESKKAGFLTSTVKRLSSKRSVIRDIKDVEEKDNE